QKQIDGLVGWRNYASAQPSGTFPSYSFTTLSTTNYITSVLGSTTRNLAPANTTLASGQSDQLFTSRQHLIQFMTALAGNGNAAPLQNALQYLSTFSRSLNQPSYWPAPDRPKVIGDGIPFVNPPATYSGGNTAYNQDNAVNPVFRTVRVGTSFRRNDGSTAAVGDPLVLKRFALSRLCWITYKGPSADLYSSNPNDPYIVALLKAGVSKQLIQEGTVQNIGNYFGLTWVSGVAGGGSVDGYWNYDLGKGTVQNKIATLAQVATAQRDANFFEILKAAAVAGGVAKVQPSNGMNAVNTSRPADPFFYAYSSNLDLSLIQIGANIISQASPANYPAAIVFSNGTYNLMVWGSVDLPYLYGDYNAAIVNRKAKPDVPSGSAPTASAPADSGSVTAINFPVVWNPYAPRSATVNYDPNLSPALLRVCISNFSAAYPTPATPATSFYYRITPQYTPTGNGTSLTQPILYAPWGGDTVSGGTMNTLFNTTSGRLDSPQNGQANNALLFTNPSATGTAFREPTALLNPSSLSNLGITLTIDGQNTLITKTSPALDSSGIPEDGTNNKFLGFFIAQYPIWFYNSGSSQWCVTNCANAQVAKGATLSLEYNLDPAGKGTWRPYKQYVFTTIFSAGALRSPYSTGATATGNCFAGNLLTAWNNGTLPNGSPDGSNASLRLGFSDLDPRSVAGGLTNNNSLRLNFVDATGTIMYSARPDQTLGTKSGSYYSGGLSKDQYVGSTFTNITDASQYVYDADGVIRRPMGAYVGGIGASSAATTYGLPMATVTTPAGIVTSNSVNRPVMLHRPFRTVAELGYVFSDLPWRNLDFSTPESAYAPLLDAFCINEDYRSDALEAGKVDLNGRQNAVFQAILSGAYRDEVNPVPNGYTTTPSAPLTSGNT
ncbi:MAG TPA: hypothetical protein VIM58_06320, partial [Candidatus Methylacidiphilales bacterium]